MRVNFQSLPKDHIGLTNRQGLALKLGEILQAKVIKAGPERALLEIKGKNVLAEVKLNVKPGEELKVRVAGQAQDKVILKVLTQPKDAPNHAEQLIKQAGGKPTPEARSALAFLLRNGLPVTKDTLQALTTDKEKPLVEVLIKTINKEKQTEKNSLRPTQGEHTKGQTKHAIPTNSSATGNMQNSSIISDRTLSPKTATLQAGNDELVRESALARQDNKLLQLGLALNPGSPVEQLTAELALLLKNLGLNVDNSAEKQPPSPALLHSLRESVTEGGTEGIRDLADKLLAQNLHQSEDGLLLHVEIPLFFDRSPTTALLQIREESAPKQDPEGKKPLSIFLNLHTEMLGQLKILVLLHNSVLNCQFSADREDTRMRLRKSLPELEERFHAMSYQVGHLGVSTIVETEEKPAPLQGQVSFRV